MGTLSAHRIALTGRFVPVLAAAVSLALILSGPAQALRTPEEGETRQVLAYAFWDRDYLCLAARVPDSALTGSSTAPMTAAEQDDAVEFDLQVMAAGEPVAHRLVISAAGGMTMFTRDRGGTWRSDDAWVRGPRTIKYAVTATGTLNDPRDSDTDFVVECAIPWEFLGGVPTGEIALPFNVVCYMQGENSGLVSWSPRVTSAAEVGEVTRWGALLITRSTLPSAAEGGTISAPLAPIVPFVDGKIGADEWMVAGLLRFAKPAPEFVPQPASSGAERRASSTSVAAIYRYDWEPAKFWRPDGLPATVDQPKEAPGPWYDYRRADWHRAQLREVTRSGIDTLLVHYRGDPESRRTWACTGLDRLTQALKELRGEGLSYPLLGLYLDTEALRGVDLRTEEGKRACYGMIRDFFLHVPPAFRAQLGSDPEQGVPGGVPVLLGEPEGLAGWDGTFQQFAATRLEREFHAQVRWLGSAAWMERGATCYAEVRLSTGAPVQTTRGEVVAFSISPGYCPPPGTPGEVTSRREGRAYRRDWQRILATGADLVVINSWNDFSNGTEIAPSRQHGYVYGDATGYFKARLTSEQPRALRLAYASVPEVMQPGRDYLVEFVVENRGTEDVVSSATVSADQRIVRRADGKEVLSRVGGQQVEVPAGQTRRLAAIIPTKSTDGKPLPQGDYVYSLVVSRTRVAYLRSKFFSQVEAELSVPITVGQPPARRATIISTSLPSSMEAGGTDAIAVQLRNDGAEVWKSGSVSLSYRWVRWTANLTADTAGARQVVAEGPRVALPKRVEPGATVLMEIPVTAAGGDGGALTPSDAAGSWSYRLQWGLVEGDTWWEEPAGEEAIEVTRRARGAVFTAAQAPQAVEAGGTFSAEVSVGNAGSRPWSPSANGIAATWVSWDGRAVVMTEDEDRFAAEVAPGEKRTRRVTLRAPEAPGPYWLVWSITGEADAAAGRRPDLLVTPVMVTTTRLRAIDLSSLTNVVAETSDSQRTRGTMDGENRSLPEECLPPDESGAKAGLYPSGSYASGREAGGAAGSALFAFPSTGAGMGGAVACTGQTVALSERGVDRVYLLAASTEGVQQTQFTLHFADGRADQAIVRVPSWTEWDRETPLAAYTPYLRGLQRDDAQQQGYLYAVTIAPAAGGITALELPGNPTVKVLAITVEEEAPPAPTGEAQ
jgi:hypothetical protein